MRPGASTRRSRASTVFWMNTILKGILLGFAIAAPVGPIGVLCIRRTLSEGRWLGFVSGLGAATADMFYASIAAFGLTALQSFLVSGQTWLRWAGGLFLIYLGARTFLSRPADGGGRTTGSPRGWLGSYLSTVGLTLTNPATILSFTMIFAGFGLSNTKGSYGSATLLVGGVFLGSSAWWLTLSSLVGLLHQKFTAGWMIWVNRISGLIILSFGIAALLL